MWGVGCKMCRKLNVMHVPGICNALYTMLSIGRMAEMGSPVSNPEP